jgi:hypothetical protein
MAPMPPSLEADVGLVHIAGGSARSTPPPGTVARRAPRRTARGRGEDLFFASLELTGGEQPSPGLRQHLVEVAAEAFYRTPGSVTSALRQAAGVANDHLLAPAIRESQGQLSGHLMLAALRGADLYVAQCGRGEVTLVRGGQVSRFGSAEAARRPLGSSPSPALRYHHLEVRAADMLLIGTAEPPAWSDPVMQSIGNLAPAQAIEQLSQARQQDTHGLLLRLVPEGQAERTLDDAKPVAASGPRPAGRPRQAARPSVGPALGQVATRLQPAVEAVQTVLLRVGAAITRGLVRLAPGWIDPPRPGEFSPAVLAVTAVAIPLVVLLAVSVVYLRRGRSQQFDLYLAEAQRTIAEAQGFTERTPAREAWALAKHWLEQADDYGESDSLLAMATQVQAALDDLDLIQRVEFTPLVGGGFGGNARISHLAATAADLYVLDAANTVLWHTWATGRGYEINREFDCLRGPNSISGMGTPVDMAVQEEPGALGAEGVVAIDTDGTLLYCAPDRRPLTGQLTPPDTGFGLIKAIDVFADTLYILDPQANAVWLYDASGGVFSGGAGLYFVDDVPDLADAIDLAQSQEELFILHADGSLDRCMRTRDAGVIQVDCEQDLRFQQERPATPANEPQPSVISEMLYSPPPEPSLYFLDSASRSVLQYSMRMVYQADIRAIGGFDDNVTALTLGPPNDLFVAAGSQVYYAQLR